MACFRRVACKGSLVVKIYVILCPQEGNACCLGAWICMACMWNEKAWLHNQLHKGTMISMEMDLQLTLTHITFFRSALLFSRFPLL